MIETLEIVVKTFLTFAVICLTWLIWTLAKVSDTRRNRSKAMNSHDSACESPNCVRCTNYSKVKSDAASRFLLLAPKYEAKKIINLENAIMTPLSREELPTRQKPNVLFMKGMSSYPFWAVDAFSDYSMYLQDIKLLEISYNSIFEEFLKIFEHPHGWTQNISETGGWCTFHIVNQGVTVSENAARCPVIFDVISNKLSNCMTRCMFGNVFISVMEPGTSIEPHYGPCNTRLRCHLGESLKWCIFTLLLDHSCNLIQYG